MNKKSSLLALLLIGGVAFAANTTIQLTKWFFKGGITIGVDSTANTITKAPQCQLDYTFPALHDDGGTTGSAHFYSAKTCTATGAAVGDPTMIGLMEPLPSATDDDDFQCIVTAANTVKVRRSGVRGSAALADAGFNCRILSNQ